MDGLEWTLNSYLVELKSELKELFNISWKCCLYFITLNAFIQSLKICL